MGGRRERGGERKGEKEEEMGVEMGRKEIERAENNS